MNATSMQPVVGGWLSLAVFDSVFDRVIFDYFLLKWFACCDDAFI
jgi:hypothetical protein